MSFVTNQLACNVCAAESSTTKDWLVAILPTGVDADVPGIAFGPLGVDVSADPGLAIEHICSHACAVKRFSQWLGTLNSPRKETDVDNS
jgi:hypothetical protein